ncbi:hypothetical protein BaRGS_00004056 [Batillaria attramentaria]|uniref:Uncharacterized protein n=1 Tax=Batillaria attramentaria TaxID=370345 RepID=A0ABD0LZC6_9CAEN
MLRPTPATHLSYATYHAMLQWKWSDLPQQHIFPTRTTTPCHGRNAQIYPSNTFFVRELQRHATVEMLGSTPATHFSYVNYNATLQ